MKSSTAPISVDAKAVSSKAQLSNELASLSAVDIVRKVHERFDRSAMLLSSFGIDSGLMIKLLHQAGVELDVLTIDTGFLLPETVEYRNQLQKHFGFKLHVYSPNDDTIIDTYDRKLWQSDLESYNQLTKIEPLRRAIHELGVFALLSGIRSWQTKNRATKQTVELGPSGEYRIHPILDWPQDVSNEFMSDILEHPLASQGYGSVGDWTTTVRGIGRTGRRLGAGSECGLHRNNF